MLHTRYPSSSHSIFREDEFWSFSSLFLCSKLWPPQRGQFWPREHQVNKLVEVYLEILHTKYQSSMPSIFREEFWSFSSYIWTCDHRGRASFNPRGIIWTNFVKVHYKMQDTKYQSSTPSSFREEAFGVFLLSSFVQTCDFRGRATFDHIFSLSRYKILFLSPLYSVK